MLPVDGGEGTAETDKKVEEPGQDECLKTRLARSLHKSRNNSETRLTFPSEFASGSAFITGQERTQERQAERFSLYSVNDGES